MKKPQEVELSPLFEEIIKNTPQSSIDQVKELMTKQDNMDTLKQKMTQAIKKLGMIKKTENFVNEKFTEDDIIEDVTQIAKQNQYSKCFEFADFMDKNFIYKEGEIYKVGASDKTYTSKEIIDIYLFPSKHGFK